ncbi:MAG: hypothetical protein IT430_20270 [Phycisphaerales bacterium]|nr:hypothetical protein [Phycisphaerales bacterium]
MNATTVKHRTPAARPQRLLLAAALALSAALAAEASAGDRRYRVVPLPLPNGATSADGLGLNNSNEVTGGVLMNQQVRPFHYADGEVTILTEIEGIYTSGYAINDKAHITGWMYEWGVIWPQAFLWDGQTNHWLIDPHHSYTYAQGLNERDQVVGFYYPPGGHPNGDAFVVSGGQYINLGAGQATDISENGIIVGQSNRYFGATTVWEPGQSGWTPTYLDGLLATAINDSGTMFVGAGPLVSYFDSAVLWTKENGQWVRTDIGNWDPSVSSAISNDVNDRGQVVGNYESFQEPKQGWIYESGQVTWLTDLLAPAHAQWHVLRAKGINETGVILADATDDPNGYGSQPVLLIPEELTILGPRGQGAGASNELIAVSAAPGSRIYFIVGFAMGSSGVPGCPGVNLGIAEPRLTGSAVADANQQATLRVNVPAAARGRTVYLQAIDPARCEVSNVLRYTFR